MSCSHIQQDLVGVFWEQTDKKERNACEVILALT